MISATHRLSRRPSPGMNAQSTNAPCMPCSSHQSKSEVAHVVAAAAAGLLMDKIDVNGSGASPVYKFLKVASGDTSPIAW